MAQKTAMRKRQKIESSNKMMFIWVTGMSVVVGFCAVLAWFLVQQIVFQSKVIGERNDTVRTLVANNEAVDELRKNVRVLETDSNLLATPKAEPDEKALQIILDALPADANSLALGASLQKKLIGEARGITIESLEVLPTANETVVGEFEDSATYSSSDGEAPSENSMPFRVVVTATSLDSLRELLNRFERSIRVMDITSLDLERSDSKFTLTLEAQAYHQPAVEVKLEKEIVKP